MRGAAHRHISSENTGCDLCVDLQKKAEILIINDFFPFSLLDSEYLYCKINDVCGNTYFIVTKNFMILGAL